MCNSKKRTNCPVCNQKEKSRRVLLQDFLKEIYAHAKRRNFLRPIFLGLYGLAWSFLFRRNLEIVKFCNQKMKQFVDCHNFGLSLAFGVAKSRILRFSRAFFRTNYRGGDWKVCRKWPLFFRSLLQTLFSYKW